MSKPTGAEAVVAAAAAAGIKVCFANPGTTEMWTVSALDKQPGIRCVLGLHETVCTGACDGYARMTRKPGMVLLHLGPGLCNGLANLHNARRARSPVLAVIGDMATWHIAADPVLNMDIQSLASSVSCVTTLVKTREEGIDGPVHSVNDTLDAMMDPNRASQPGRGVIGRVGVLILPHDISWECEGAALIYALVSFAHCYIRNRTLNPNH
jgi:thiamine pyrophosphate-dependent acetolactate synthase large subunit-like protein